MPKAVKSHRVKKDGAAHDLWIDRKRTRNASNKQKKIFQKWWRQECLAERFRDNRLTTKNQKEIPIVGKY